MTSEQEYFLNILKCFINRKEISDHPDTIDWNELFRIAEEQSLSGIVYPVIRSLPISEEVVARFHDAFHSSVYYSVNNKAAMDEITVQYEKNEIPFIPFKGWTVKECWPVPELRSMGDIDLLIHPSDREKADTVMKSLGYSTFIDNHAVWHYMQRDIMFEIHDQMFYEYLGNSVDYTGYFDQAWSYCNPDMDINFHYLYLIAHIAKHITNKGIGFRGFMDLVFYSDYYSGQLDWNHICEELDKLKLLKFTYTCLALNKKWFDKEPPIPVPELDEDFYIKTTEKVFNDGIFGLDNEENRGASATKEINHTGRGYLLGSLRLTVKKAFPSYRDMQLIPWYSFVDGKPWLMPYAWIYRWIYCLTHKPELSIYKLTEPYLKKEMIKERETMIKDWGL